LVAALISGSLFAEMNASMPMFRSLVISVLQRFMNRRQNPNASPQLAGARPMRNPKLNAALAALAVLYAISPVDALPDIVPIVGWLDDGLVLWFGLSQAWKAMRGSAADPAPAAASGAIVETTATRVR
jgi:uncharacterized membrane protein YkvA (DUF1232 family)